MPYSAYESVALSTWILWAFWGKVVDPAGRLVLDDVLLSLSGQVESARLAKLVHDSIDRGLSPERAKQMAAVVRELKRVSKATLAAWPKRRGSLPVRRMEEHCRNYARFLDGLPKTLKAGRWLKVRFCLVNQHGAERTVIRLREKGVWRTVANGVFKSPTGSSVYEWFFPIPAGAPDAIRFECRGFGGQGIAYAEVVDRNRKTSLRPSAIVEKAGQVADESYILSDDVRYAFFGSQSVIDGFIDRSVGAATHSLTALLEKNGR